MAGRLSGKVALISGGAGGCGLAASELFAREGLRPRVALTARDSDVIKTYVRLGMGVGIVASVAFEPEVDSDLVLIDASHLFPIHTTWVGFRRGTLLRNYAYDFMQLFGPHLSRRLIDQEWVKINLARVYAGLEFLRLINWKVAWSGTRGKLDVADASTIKVFGTEWYLESFRLLMEIIGPRAYLRRESPEALQMIGHLEVLYRSLLILTFGGGTNEIQRDLISLFGLGFPRVPRM